MSNTNTNLQTQTSNALHNAIMEAGGKDRPPMLALGNYVQWKSRIKRYIDTKPNNELIHYCLQNPPYKFKWTEKTVLVAEAKHCDGCNLVFSVKFGICCFLVFALRDNNRGSRDAALFDNLEEGGSRDIIGDDYENDNSDVFSYPEDESVTDPFLADHLEFFGIDFSSLQKLRRNLTRTLTLIGIGFKKVERKLNHVMDLVDTTVLGLSDHEALKNPYIASMGVYVFRTEVLLELLKWKYPSCNDFGSEIIPSAVAEHNVQAYLFKDYWEDIGTIKSFFHANLALTEQIVDAIISHGCFLRDCSVEHSVVGIRSRLDEGVELKDTMMIGADYYQTDSAIAAMLASGRVPIGVGQNTKIKNCIIDKNAKIGKNVVIANKNNVEEADRSDEGFYIRSAAK
ncbi:glucose-1-phosphate adenylyltransferase large subunit, chloroplastic/amyloplastic-like protein [Tanacetum coccineum]